MFELGLELLVFSLPGITNVLSECLSHDTMHTYVRIHVSSPFLFVPEDLKPIHILKVVKTNRHIKLKMDFKRLFMILK